MWEEFKKFAIKGNVVELAVGVIIGGAFGKIVSSLVDDVIMPIIGLFLGGIDFTNLHLQIGDAIIKYGSFIQSIVDFLIISFSIFIFIRTINNIKEKEEEEKPKERVLSNEEKLLVEIRDLLKLKQKNNDLKNDNA